MRIKWPFWSKVYWESEFYVAKCASVGFAIDADWLLGYGHVWVGSIGFVKNMDTGKWHFASYKINLDES